jgi:hypothetical protein
MDPSAATVIPARFVAEVSGGHSTLVSAARDLAALDIDLATITQAGGWRLLQYAEKFLRRVRTE